MSCPLGVALRACPDRRARALVPRGQELSAGAPSGDAFCARGGPRAACPALSAWRPARVVTRCRSGGTVGARPAPPDRHARALVPRGQELSAGAPSGDAFCARGGPRAACPAPSAGRPARVATRCRSGGAVRRRPAPPVRRARALVPRGQELSVGAPSGDAFCARGGPRAACPAPSAGRPARVATRCRSGGAVRARPAPPVRRARALVPRGQELSVGAPSGDAFCARGGPRAACPAPSAERPARVATRCRSGGAVRARPAPPVRRDARGNVGGRG